MHTLWFRIINRWDIQWPLECNEYERFLYEIFYNVVNDRILGLEKSYDIAANYEANLLEDNTDLKQEFEALLNVITNYLQQL